MTSFEWGRPIFKGLPTESPSTDHNEVIDTVDNIYEFTPYIEILGSSFAGLAIVWTGNDQRHDELYEDNFGK